MISFFVAGTPVPKGSAKAFVVKGRAIVTQDNGAKQKPWASAISYTAAQHKSALIIGPVSISVIFTMPRLKGHYGTGSKAALIKQNAPLYHTSKPDLDKLLRCVKDALTGVIWKDDSQVAIVSRLSKSYGDRPGVLITVEEL